MRKNLFATTAVAAMTLASGATAMESEMGTAMGNDVLLGGFYEFGVYSLDDDHKGPADSGDAHTYGNGKLYIDFESTSDNDLTYGVHIDMPLAWWKPHNESHDAIISRGAAKNSLEASIFLAGDFGRAILGHDDYAYDYFVTPAPTHDNAWSRYDFGISPSWLQTQGTSDTADDNRSRAFLGAPSNDLLVVGGSLVRDTNDAKAVYLTPVIGGFQFGIGTQDDDRTKDNPLSFGASYTMGDLYGASLKLTFASYNNNQDTDMAAATMKQTQDSIGINVGFGDFTVTASSTGQEAVIGRDNASDLGIGDPVEVDKSNVEFGLGYNVSDVLAFGASQADAETEGTGINLEGTFSAITGKYQIAPGLHTALAYNIFEIEDTNNPSRNNKGTLFAWNVEFAF